MSHALPLCRSQVRIVGRQRSLAEGAAGRRRSPHRHHPRHLGDAPHLPAQLGLAGPLQVGLQLGGDVEGLALHAHGRGRQHPGQVAEPVRHRGGEIPAVGGQSGRVRRRHLPARDRLGARPDLPRRPGRRGC